jgi:hypothetical protein
MLLVLISLAMAVILATAYLSSRDNSIPLSRNASASAEARWAGVSAQETAVAVLETQANWRSMSQGVLLDDFPLLGVNEEAGVEVPPFIRVRVEASDIETAAPPIATTRYVRVTASAQVDRDGDGSADGGGSARFIAYVPTVPDPYAVVDLSDFAAFARKSLLLSGDSRIARWPVAPLSALRRRVHVGTSSINSGAVTIIEGAACIDCTVHKPPLSSPTLVDNDNGPPVAQHQMPFACYFPQSPPLAPGPDGSRPNYTQSGGEAVFDADKSYSRITLENGARLTLRGHITIIASAYLQLMGNTNVRLIIDGHVTLVVFKDLIIEPTAAIELSPGSTLDLYVKDDVEITDGYIGEVRSNNLRDHTGQAPYSNVNAIRIFSIDPNSAEHLWFLHSNSVVKGNLYGRLVTLDISGASAVYGRVAVESLMMNGSAGLFYDHAIDQRQGFTNPDSPLYDGNNLNSALAPVSLDPVLLQTMAIATFTTLRANAVDYAPLPTPPTPPPPPGTPTPRPVHVDYTLEALGEDIEAWESTWSGG